MDYLINLLIIPIYYWIIALRTADIAKSNKIFAIVVCMHVTLFRALANPFNYVDTDLYDEGFVAISNMTFSDAILSVNFYTHWGQGFLLFNWIIGQFTHESIMLFILSSFLAIIPVIWFYYKLSYRKLLLSVLLYLTYPMMYYMGFGVLREHLAVPFILLAIYYIDNWKISVPLAIIGFLFHTSAIIFFPYYMWRKFNFSYENRFKILFYIGLIVLVMRVTMGYILSFMPKYDEIVKSNTTENNITPVLIFGIITYFLSSLDLSKIDKRYVDIQKFMYYGLAVSLFSIGIHGLGRLTIYFLYVIPVAISIFIVYSRAFTKKVWLMLSILIIYVRQIYYLTIEENITYNFFWE